MIILASRSPRRKELLGLITTDFSVKPTDVDETVPDNISVYDTAEFLSRIKASALAGEVSDDDIIIGADTVVICDGQIFGKPENKNDAFNILSKLSGKTHKVITGVTIIKNKTVNSFSVTTEVTFYKLSENEINEYIATNEPMDKAGAYGIQGKGSLLVEKINGDYFNVVGLPVGRLSQELKK